jgi:DNA modification methylase
MDEPMEDPGRAELEDLLAWEAIERNERLRKHLQIDDADFQLYVGDALAVLAELPADSINCVVTSPPYWGLRDYGTGTWDGGNPDCDHVKTIHRREQPERSRGWDGNFRYTSEPVPVAYADECGKCGARRVDQQLGLEPTPDAYITNMVRVFAEVRRVLRSDGTCWVNIGDSYMANVGTHAPQTKQHIGSGFCGPNRTPQSGLKPKDLVGIPWQLAFALRSDGWYLRAEIIWAKPNPMPESVTDRPTKAHEQIFLLTKSPRYWYDADAIREAYQYDGRIKTAHDHQTNGSHTNHGQMGDGRDLWPGVGRNARSVWEIATEPYPDAHFATFPTELARRCILAGCPEHVCGTCGKARERIVEATGATNERNREDVGDWIRDKGGNADGKRSLSGATYKPQRAATGGWSDCGHNNHHAGVVLDPFLGSGTTAFVARQHGRKCIGIELNPAYADLIAKRTQQLSLIA